MARSARAASCFSQHAPRRGAPRCRLPFTKRLAAAPAAPHKLVFSEVALYHIYLSPIPVMHQLPDPVGPRVLWLHPGWRPNLCRLCSHQIDVMWAVGVCGAARWPALHAAFSTLKTNNAAGGMRVAAATPAPESIQSCEGWAAAASHAAVLAPAAGCAVLACAPLVMHAYQAGHLALPPAPSAGLLSTWIIRGCTLLHPQWFAQHTS